MLRLRLPNGFSGTIAIPKGNGYKKTAELTAANPGVDVFFFDEARFGLRPALGRKWARRGRRPVAVVRTGYNSSSR